MSNGKREDIRMGVNWIKPAQDRIQQLAPLESVRGEEFLGKLCSHQLLKEASASWSEFIPSARRCTRRKILPHALPYLQSLQHRNPG
jgi:hypothetical protein